MNKLDRRGFLKMSGVGLLTSTVVENLMARTGEVKTHIYSLSFDDGFERSFQKVADIYEKYDLKACFNVIASAHERNFVAPDEYQAKGKYGDFQLWNALKARGHEVMPHTYKHANLTRIPFQEARELILKCLDFFDEHLDGFKRKESIYNFAFNASNEEIEHWLEDQVLAYRTAGPVINPMPFEGQKKLTCISYGPDNADKFLMEQTDEFLKQPKGWFIFNTHGLDGEGWGPISGSFLDELLDRLRSENKVAILPVGSALLQCN